MWRAMYGTAGGRADVAEEAVAEAFARAIERSDSIRNPVAWLYKTAFRLVVQELKPESTVPRLTKRSEGPSEAETRPPNPDPGEKVAASTFIGRFAVAGRGFERIAGMLTRGSERRFVRGSAVQ